MNYKKSIKNSYPCTGKKQTQSYPYHAWNNNRCCIGYCNARNW